MGKIFCLNACGGSGKTYLINLLLMTVRASGAIALATATSGIAATLLQGGRTAHSTFKVPVFNIDEASMCKMTKIDMVGKLMQRTQLIIIDEVTMGNKLMYECIDRSLSLIHI